MNSKKKIIILLAVFLLLILTGVVFTRQSDDAPTHLIAEEVTSKEITISWIGDERSSQYNIYRSDNEEYGFERIDFSLNEKYTDKGLSSNKEYFYAVTQIIDFRESSFSHVLRVVTEPGVPQNINARTVSFHEELAPRIDLWWDYSVGVDYYNIYRGRERDGVYAKVGTSSNENYSDRDVSSGEKYYYAITQVSNDRESVFSERVSAVTDIVWSCGDRLSYGDRFYRTVKIGDQCWFQENLNIVNDEETEGSCSVTRLCYGDDVSWCDDFGGIYSFESASCNEKHEGMQGLCPLGWRIPSDNDWITLETQIGMKEAEVLNYGYRGTNQGSLLAGNSSLWRDGYLVRNPGFGASGFNILPGGTQVSPGSRIFRDKGESVVFWTSTNATNDGQCRIFRGEGYNTRIINYNNEGVRRECLTEGGAAYVRCVRDYR